MPASRIAAFLLAAATVLIVRPATAQIAVPSDGSDGVLSLGCCGTTTIDLANALTGNWDDPVAPEDEGRGIYDPSIWAVVFKYESVSLSNRTLQFTNHPSGAPVVWLVEGDVTIASTAHLHVNSNGRTAGPGGGHGGTQSSGGEAISAGRGPGGGGVTPGGAATGGSYAAQGTGPAPGPIYGNPGVFPLIGGSGGTAITTANGGGGGGAILIAAGGRITVDGSLTANGHSVSVGTAGAGSGGGIRLIADEIVGTGTISARGGTGTHAGGFGRIRLEANAISLTSSGIPEASVGTVVEPLRLFPDASTPTIRSVSLGGENVPDDPRPGGVDLTLADPGVHELTIEAENVPTDSIVTVRVTPRTGEDFSVEASFVSGNITASTWTATLDLPSGASHIGVRAELP